MVLWYSLKSGIVVSPVLVFWLRVALASQCLLCFYVNFKIEFFMLVKNVVGLLIGIALTI
jgi:hypothetical protein